MFISDLLSAGMSEAEVAAVMKEHDREMQDALRKLDAQRDKQSEQLRSKLAERRRQKMAALRNKHAKEVQLLNTKTTQVIHKLLQRCHVLSTKASDVGLPQPPQPFDNSDDRLKTEQLVQQLLQAQQATSIAKTDADNSDLCSEDQVKRYQRGLKEQLVRPSTTRTLYMYHMKILRKGFTVLWSTFLRMTC